MGSKKLATPKIPEKLNGNTLAQYLATQEGGKHQLSIAQIKEVVSKLSKVFVARPFEMIALLKRIGSK